MIKKFQNNDLFEKLDWVLKKKGKSKEYESQISFFIFNRWLSMSDPAIAQIVNATTNRWNLQKNSFWEENFFLKFFRIILPKISKRISYIKKTQKEKTDTDYTNIANVLEISEREITLYETTLAEIKDKTK